MFERCLGGRCQNWFFFTGTNFVIHWAVSPSFLLQDAKKKKEEETFCAVKISETVKKEREKGPDGVGNCF